METPGPGICLDAPDSGLMRYEVDGMKQAEVLGSGEVNVESKERETTPADVRRIAADPLPEAVDAVHRDMVEDGGNQRDVLRFQSDVVTRRGPRLLSQRVGECS